MLWLLDSAASILSRVLIVASALYALFWLGLRFEKEILGLFGEVVEVKEDNEDKASQTKKKTKQKRLLVDEVEGEPPAPTPASDSDEEEEEEAEKEPTTARLTITRSQLVRYGVMTGILVLALGVAVWQSSDQYYAMFERTAPHSGASVPQTARERLGPRKIHGPLKTCAYYQPFEYTTRDGTAVPVVTCACYVALNSIHAAVLGPGPAPKSRSAEVAVTGMADVARNMEEERWRMRQLVHDRCFFEDVDFMALPHEHVILRKQTVPWDFEHPEHRAVHGGMIKHFMLSSLPGPNQDEDLVPYVSVLAVRPLPGKSDTITYMFTPVMVALPDVIASARQWYDDMLRFARQEEALPDEPCLCAEHLGIVNSGLYFLHTGQGRWQLMLHPRVTTNLLYPGEVSTIEYKKRLGFPAQIDAAYNTSAAVHYGHVEVTYWDIEALLASPQGREEVGRILPRWWHQQTTKVKVGEEEEEEGDADVLPDVSLFHACPLDRLDPVKSAGVKRVQLKDLPNRCLHHCYLMSKVARTKLGFGEEEEALAE